jgi:MFS family permease
MFLLNLLARSKREYRKAQIVNTSIPAFSGIFSLTFERLTTMQGVEKKQQDPGFNKGTTVTVWRSKQFATVLLLSFAFAFLFFGFSSAQSIQTTAHRTDPTLGPRTLLTVYIGYMISCLIATTVVTRIGIRASFIISCFAYVLFIGSNMFSVPALSFIGAACCGLGAGVIWTAHGVYITNLATEYEIQNDLVVGSTLGTFNGIFWSIFQFARVSSTASVAVSFEEHESEKFVFVMLTIAAVLGNCLFLCIRVPKNKHSMEGTAVGGISKVETVELGSNSLEVETTTEIKSTVTEEIVIVKENPILSFLNRSSLANLKLISNPKLGLILPIVVYQGIALGFIFGVMPTLSSDPALRFFALASFSVADMVSCMVMGRLSDKIGRRHLLYVGALVHLLALGMVLLSNGKVFEPFPYILLAILFGLGDGAWTTLPGAIIGGFFKDKSTAAFANFRLAQAIGVTVALSYYPYVSVHGKGWIAVVTMSVGIGCLQLLHSCIESIDPKKFSMPKQ